MILILILAFFAMIAMLIVGFYTYGLIALAIAVIIFIINLISKARAEDANRSLREGFHSISNIENKTYKQIARVIGECGVKKDFIDEDGEEYTFCNWVEGYSSLSIVFDKDGKFAYIEEEYLK